MKQEAGTYHATWDGLDRYGNPVSPGTYTWKLLRTPGFEAKYLTTVGTNPKTHPYDVWVGNHTGPTAVAVDREGMYVGSSVGEGVPILVKQSMEGKSRFWESSQYEAWMGPASMAANGGGFSSQYLQLASYERGPGIVQIIPPSEVAAPLTGTQSGNLLFSFQMNSSMLFKRDSLDITNDKYSGIVLLTNSGTNNKLEPILRVRYSVNKVVVDHAGGTDVLLSDYGIDFPHQYEFGLNMNADTFSAKVDGKAIVGKFTFLTPSLKGIGGFTARGGPVASQENPKYNHISFDNIRLVSSDKVIWDLQFEEPDSGYAWNSNEDKPVYENYTRPYSLQGNMTRLTTDASPRPMDKLFRAGVSEPGGGRLYLLQPNAKIQVVDAITGKRLATWDASWEGATDEQEEMDLDARGETIVVSYRTRNTVRWLNTENGTTLAEVSVPAPQGVTVAANGVVYAITNSGIQALSKQGILPHWYIDGLVNPCRLTFDFTNNHLLVVEKAPSNQIKRFDLKGALVQTYGRYEGRAYGAFVPIDFNNVLDIAADGTGGFIIAEGGRELRRVARFSSDGKFVAQWFGSQPFFNFSSADPSAPSEVYFMGGYSSKAVAKIDYQSGKWEVIADYFHPQFGDGLFPSPSHYTSQWHVRNRNGKTYLVCDTNAGPAIVRVDKAAGKLVPVAAAGNVNKRKPPLPWLDAIALYGYSVQSAPSSYAWSDKNGDGEFQPSEFVLGGSYPLPTSPFHLHIDDDWNVSIPKPRLHQEDGVAWYTLPNKAVGEDVPSWNCNDIQPAVARMPEELRQPQLGTSQSAGLARDPRGNTYMFVKANRGVNDDRHGAAWPSFNLGSARLIRWNPGGELQWSVGRHAAGNVRDLINPTPKGQYHEPARILGIINDCVVVGDRVVNPADVWTSDGLYAGSFLDRRADDGLPGRLYHWWRDPETMHSDNPLPYDMLKVGSLVNRENGEVIWFPMGEQNTPVYRISGWTGWERQTGTVRVKSAPPRAARGGTGLKAEYFKNTTFSGLPVITRTDEQIWFEQATKRKQTYRNWTYGPGAPMTTSGNFSVRWSGFIEGQLGEDYTFSIYSQGGARLWVNGSLIIDAWTNKAQKVLSKPIQLTPRTKYPIKLEYYNQGGKAALSLNWESVTQERQRIPQAYLYPRKES